MQLTLIALTCLTASVQEPAPAAPSEPMASFARMLPGEWRVTYESGTSQFNTWRRGPGDHSMRELTDGLSGGGEPWRALKVLYRYPDTEQIRTLSISPFRKSVSEGTLSTRGDSVEGVFDLYQAGERRKMAVGWVFDGPNRYSYTLLEDVGAGYKSIGEWSYSRSMTLTAPGPNTSDTQPSPSPFFKALEALVGPTWEAKGAWVTGAAVHTRTTFEWVPYADYIYVRSLALTDEGEPTHLLDAFIYHHNATGSLRCLALTSAGGVYDGDLSVLAGGAVQFELKGHKGEQVVPFVVRFEFEHDAARTLRSRTWSLEHGERELLLDARHKQLKKKPD